MESVKEQPKAAQELIEQALEAERYFSLDELEAFAEQCRKGKEQHDTDLGSKSA